MVDPSFLNTCTGFFSDTGEPIVKIPSIAEVRTFGIIREWYGKRRTVNGNRVGEIRFGFRMDRNRAETVLSQPYSDIAVRVTV